MARAKTLKRTKDRSKSEELLIAAARKVFSEVGYAASTTRMIAQESGVNLGLISRYFGSKHGLLVAVVEHEIAESPIDLPYPPQESLKAECIAYAKAKLKKMFQSEALLRIIVTELITNDEFLDSLSKSSVAGNEKVIRERILGFLPAGNEIARKKAAIRLSNFLDAAILGVATFQFLIAREPQAKCIKDIEANLSLFFDVNSAVK